MYIKESMISLMIGFGFSIILFSIGLDRFEDNISGLIFGIIVIGLMVSGSIFLVWIRKQNLKN